MACAVINKEGGSLSSPCIVYMYVVFLSFMMWDRGQSIDTRISHVPAAHQNGGKPNLNFCRYKNISKLVSAAWQSFDFIYSDMIEHHREQENLYYVQYILIAKSPSITSCCQSN